MLQRLAKEDYIYNISHNILYKSLVHVLRCSVLLVCVLASCVYVLNFFCA